MSAFTDVSNLIFFKTEKYHYKNSQIFDASALPRPHYCIGLILSGESVFRDSSDGEEIAVKRGDIIFVPMGSRYVSNWKGAPDITYVSMHFVFGVSELFPQKNSYRFCKITLPDFEKTKKIFVDMLSFSNADDVKKLQLISEFYTVLSEILPHLSKKEEHSRDLRLEEAVRYVEQNYNKKLSVEELAVRANMSVSRFFPYFKNEFGMTPVDYVNNYRIRCAVVLLMNDDTLSVENVAERVGFDSSAYFRRVFKKITGVSPREYKKISTEL
ncbi:MAG: helix-turn-helix transcriptional regulator [Ruminococcaceae bacterium]|nr:helix-turn-helix transcriptional regulator [Oscillospiraceae bacterium]